MAWPTRSTWPAPRKVLASTAPLLLLVLLLVLARPAWAAAVERAAMEEGEGDRGRPNIILIVTDDQDILLGGGVESMPNLVEHVVGGGATIDKAFANTPVCCPSRATILTGLYPHNSGVTNNGYGGNCGSAAWRDGPGRKNIGFLLQSLAGYRTGFFGKYTNTYGDQGGPEPLAHVPPGWGRWVGACTWPSNYYNYTLSVDGRAEPHGDDYAADYLTDVIANRSLDFIDEAVRDGRRPFFAMLTPTAPHEMADPAPQYAHLLEGVTAPRLPSYNVTPDALLGRARNWLTTHAVSEAFDAGRALHADLLFRRRSLALMSVDDMVGRLVRRLEELGVADRTYIVYTSDHGYHLGEFGLVMDKRLPYETDIRIPFYARGPGIAPGSVIAPSQGGLAGLVDLAPTLLDMAGVHPAAFSGLDGRSLLGPLTQGRRGAPPPPTPRTELLVEYQGETVGVDKACPQYAGAQHVFVLHRGPASFRTPPGYPADTSFPQGSCFLIDSRNNTYRCLRTVAAAEDSLFCRYHDRDGTVEFYDLATDPWSLNNLAGSLAAEEVARRTARLRRMAGCRGDRECTEGKGVQMGGGDGPRVAVAKAASPHGDARFLRRGIGGVVNK